ncbi:pyrroline-5-carboxylate reductase [Mangrovicella endophytica]|uniref:pyrroline-5-carboxylate reductase n=1 Tax=Mangrovicella endophytica TaxID=2066697 RepID=UPI000C9DAC4D|nr:pyrroline-5-carboxylate reductase [Mangrovicella endophytica]
MSTRLGRILLLGGGNMGGAMLGGWIAAGIDPSDVLIVDPNPGEAVRPLIEERGVRLAASVPAEPVDVVVVAVKPQVMADVLASLQPALKPSTLVISVAAGKTIAFIEARLGARPVVRAMPNTPALIGRGITGCYGNEAVIPALRDATTTLLSGSGPVEWVDSEALIDVVTGVSGSGPAYVFLLAEALAAAGAAAGLEPDLAMRLARHTVAGAGELMIRSDKVPAELRRAVTSPNGTTQAALEILMADDGLNALMTRAVAASVNRARELAKD